MDLDVGEPLVEPGDEPGIDFDRHHSVRAPQERSGQYACAGSEIEKEVAGPNTRRANELRCELATAEKMLASAAS